MRRGQFARFILLPALGTCLVAACQAGDASAGRSRASEANLGVPTVAVIAPTATPTAGPPIAPDVIRPAGSPSPAPTSVGGNGPAAAADGSPPAVVGRTEPSPAAPSPTVPAPTPDARPSATASPMPSPTPVPPTPTPWLPRTRQVGEVQVRLHELEQGQTPDGRPVVRLRAEIANQGDRSAFFADLYFKLIAADGQRFDPVTNVESPDRLHQGPLAPGQSTSGYLWYLVGPGTRPAAILYDGPTGQTTFPIPG